MTRCLPARVKSPPYKCTTHNPHRTSMFTQCFHFYPHILTNSELEKVSSWFIANKLSINIKKTNFMLFKPRQKKCALNQPLLIDGKEIEQVSQTSFLGVIINQNLSWKSHIGCITSKIAKSAGIIYKSKFYLPKQSLLSLYYALVYPYLHYCNLVWASICI